MSKKNSSSSAWLVALGGVLVVGAFALLAVSGGGSRMLSGNDFLSTYGKTPNAVMVDVRTPAEFASGHIVPAINVDFENQNFRDEVKKLDPSKTYFVYCRSGNRSGQSVAIMKSSGIKDIYELQGGLISNTSIPLVISQ